MSSQSTSTKIFYIEYDFTSSLLPYNKPTTAVKIQEMQNLVYFPSMHLENKLNLTFRLKHLHKLKSKDEVNLKFELTILETTPVDLIMGL